MARKRPQSSEANKIRRDDPVKSLRAPKLSKGQFSALVALIADAAETGEEAPSSVRTSVQHISPPRFIPKSAPAKVSKRSKQPTQHVSLGGIFTKAKNQVYKEAVIKTREKKLDPPLLIDFQEGLETAYKFLEKDVKKSFAEVHAGLVDKLGSIKLNDDTFHQRISVAAENLSAPLTEEMIEIQVQRNGKKVKETVAIGNRVAQYKKFIEKEDAKLKDLWKQWDELQNRYIALGVDVFGTKAFGKEALGDIGMGNGLKGKLEKMDKDNAVALEKLKAEVEGIRKKTEQNMASSEKDLDARLRNEQTRILTHLMA